jgi:hypothetical protein
VRLFILPRPRFWLVRRDEMGRHEEALGSLDRGDLDDVVPRRTGTVSEIDCEPYVADAKMRDEPVWAHIRNQPMTS